MSVAICAKCSLSASNCAGPCPCTVDGSDILAHAKAEYCPHPDGPEFGDGVKPEVWPPHDPIQWLKSRPTYPMPEGYDPKDYALDSKGSEGCNC